MTQTNKHGQALGRKGAESRARLIEAARGLIVNAPQEPLTPTSVARAAKLASQSYYLYFTDVDELLLWLADEAKADISSILAELEGPWDSDTLDAQAMRFVAAYYSYWDRHRAILTIRNSRADLGQKAFVTVRNESTTPIVRRLAERIRVAQGGERFAQRDALARSIILVAAIERMASHYAVLDSSPTALDVEDLKRAEADILKLMLSPQAV